MEEAVIICYLYYMDLYIIWKHGCMVENLA